MRGDNGTDRLSWADASRTPVPGRLDQRGAFFPLSPPLMRTCCCVQSLACRLLASSSSVTWYSLRLPPTGSIENPDDEPFVDLELVASLPFHEKWIWFVQQMDLLQEPWENGHVLLAIERENLLQQSFEQFLNLEEQHLHKYLRVSFQDEPGLDAGGIEREWSVSLRVQHTFNSIVNHLFRNAPFGALLSNSLLKVHAGCARGIR